MAAAGCLPAQVAAGGCLPAQVAVAGCSPAQVVAAPVRLVVGSQVESAPESVVMLVASLRQLVCQEVNGEEVWAGWLLGVKQIQVQRGAAALVVAQLWALQVVA
jgi:hypothetical protein